MRTLQFAATIYGFMFKYNINVKHTKIVPSKNEADLKQ